MPTVNTFVGTGNDDYAITYVSDSDFVASNAGDAGRSIGNLFTKFGIAARIPVEVPQGATITSATLRLRVNTTYSGGSFPDFRCLVNAADNSAGFSDGTNIGSTRSWYAATLTQIASSYSVDDAVDLNVTAGIQSLVNRGGFVENNYCTIAVADDESLKTDPNLGVYMYNGSTTKCPELIIVYSTGPASVDVTGAMSTPASVMAANVDVSGFNVTGAMDTPATTMSASAGFDATIAITGAMSAPATTMLASATSGVAVEITGAMSTPASTMSGEAVAGVDVTVTGAMDTPVSTMSGVVLTSNLVSVTGAMSTPSITMAASVDTQSDVEVTGAMTSPASQMSGTVVVNSAIAVTGAMSTPNTTMNGVVDLNATVTVTGAMTTPNVEMSGVVDLNDPQLVTGAMSTPNTTMFANVVINQTIEVTGAMTSSSTTMNANVYNQGFVTVAGAMDTPVIEMSASVTVEALPDYSDTQSAPFRLELHEQDGTLIDFLPDFIGGSWSARANEPETLTFSYAGDDSRTSGFVFPNEVWLLRGDNTTALQKFIITKINESESEARAVDVEARSYLYQLSKEMVSSYDSTGKTIEDIVDDIFTYQTQTPAITAGFIDDDIKDEIRTLNIEGKSILESLNDIKRSIGGYFAVTTSREFVWHRQIGTEHGFQLRIGKNCNLIKKNIDLSNIATRITAYGRGSDKDIRLISTKNDAPAQATYGIIQDFVPNQTISNKAMLDKIAQAELDRRKVPRITYDVDAVDLSQTDVLDFSFEASMLEIGTILNLIGGQSDVDIYTQVCSVTRSLTNPLDVQVNVTNPDAGTVLWGQNESIESQPKTLLDYVAALYKKTKIQEFDTGTLDEIMAGIAGGTLETPSATPLDGLDSIQYYNLGTNTGNLGTSVSGIIQSDPDIQDDINDVITARFSTDTPEPVAAAGSVGSSEELSHSNHVHEGVNEADLPDLVSDIIQNDTTVQGDIENITNTTIVNKFSTSTPQDVAPTGDVGISEDLARADHRHAGGSDVAIVTSLPAIPTSGMLEVFWTSAGVGTGDDQVWRVYAGQSAFTPTQFTSSLSGTP